MKLCFLDSIDKFLDLVWKGDNQILIVSGTPLTREGEVFGIFKKKWGSEFSHKKGVVGKIQVVLKRGDINN